MGANPSDRPPTAGETTTPEMKLSRLRRHGFSVLMKGKIHLRCPECGRKMSNVDREEFDPPDAFLAEILCGECADSVGAMEPTTLYFDRQGNEVKPQPAAHPEEET